MKKATKPRKKTAKAAKRAARPTARQAARQSADDLRPEYDFRGGARGKYASRYQSGSNIVVLDPDVAAAFKDAEAVNHALRTLLELVPPPAKRRRRTT
jgi:hypothetical protein